MKLALDLSQQELDGGMRSSTIICCAHVRPSLAAAAPNTRRKMQSWPERVFFPHRIILDKTEGQNRYVGKSPVCSCKHASRFNGHTVLWLLQSNKHEGNNTFFWFCNKNIKKTFHYLLPEKQDSATRAASKLREMLVCYQVNDS